VIYLLKEHKPRRIVDIERDEEEKRKRDEEEKSQGIYHFDRLRELLVARGQNEFASVVTFSTYRSKASKLSVNLPAQYRARFIGKDGRNIKEISATLGVEIGLERDGQEGRR